VTQSNAANAEEIASSSEELSAQAHELTRVVGTLLHLITGSDAAQQALPESPHGARDEGAWFHDSANGPGARTAAARDGAEPRRLGRRGLPEPERASGKPRGNGGKRTEEAPQQRGPSALRKALAEAEQQPYEEQDFRDM